MFYRGAHKARNQQLSERSLLKHLVFLLNRSGMNGVCLSNYNCEKAAFIFEGVPFSGREGAAMWSRCCSAASWQWTVLIVGLKHACRFFLVCLFVSFHFGCKQIAAVVLWDWNTQLGSSLLCVVIRLWRGSSCLRLSCRGAMKDYCASHFVYKKKKVCRGTLCCSARPPNVQLLVKQVTHSDIAFV